MDLYSAEASYCQRSKYFREVIKKLPVVYLNNEYDLSAHPDVKEWIIVPTWTWDTQYHDRIHDIRTRNPLEYAFKLLQKDKMVDFFQGMQGNPIFNGRVFSSHISGSLNYSSSIEFVLNGLNALNELGKKITSYVANINHAGIILHDNYNRSSYTVLDKLRSKYNDALFDIIELSRINLGYGYSYNKLFSIKNEGEVIIEREGGQRDESYLWDAKSMLALLNKDPLDLDLETTFQKLTWNLRHYDPVVLNKESYEENVKVITNNEEHNVVFFWKPDLIKRFLKETTSNSYSTNNTAKYGLLIKGDPSDYTASKFWTYGQSSFDALTPEEVVSNLFNFGGNSRHRYEVSAHYLSLVGNVKYLETPITSFDKIEYESHEKWKVAGRVEVKNGKTCSIQSVILGDFIRNHYLRLARIANKEEVAKLRLPIFKGLVTDWFQIEIKRYKKIHQIALGGTVDHELLKTTKFEPYIKYLSKSQHSKLRLAINKGDVNEDVLNLQPFTVWFLLNINVGLGRIKNKKKKIFDGLKWNQEPPIWLKNLIFKAPEEVNTYSLENKKVLYKLVRQFWNDQRSYLWLLHDQPKIFSAMNEETLRYTLEHQAWMMQTINLEFEDEKNHAETIGARPNNQQYPPGTSVDQHLDFKRGKLKELHDNWKKDLESKKNGTKKYALEWKQHCLTFRELMTQTFTDLDHNTSTCPGANWKVPERDDNFPFILDGE